MARHRKHFDNERQHPKGPKHDGNRSKENTESKDTDKFRHGVFIAIIIGLFAFGAYNYYRRSLELKISTPLDVPRAVSSQSPQRYWGSYRPGVYFGMKTRSPHSPVVGSMWFSQKLVGNNIQLRHGCEMGDYNQRYSWLEHDGENYGSQKIYDDNIVLTTSFVKRLGGHYGGDWTARFSVEPLVGRHLEPISLMFYVALDGDGSLEPSKMGNTLEKVSGTSEATGRFHISFLQNGTHKLTNNYLSTVTRNLAMLQETVLHSLAYFSVTKQSTKYIGLIGEKYPQNEELKHPNFIVHQVTGIPPFDLEVIYESSSFLDRPNSLKGREFDEELSIFREAFNKKFEGVFQLQKRNYSKGEIDFCKAALSNLIGGIGYFYGFSVVQSEFNKLPIPYFEGALYSAVPSRSFFPRGFLWDEGFHNLMILQWNMDIAKDIIAHWLDMINIEGWIPREQILDDESRSRVPPEFIIQRNTNANPPSLFLPLKIMIKDMKKDEQLLANDIDFLSRIFPRLKAWFHWFNSTQVGHLPGTYRWRGRNGTNLEELNPLTLTSGLDDYPRASHPTEDERHVDLRCWIAFAAGVMADIAREIGEPWNDYAATHAFLSDNKLLDKLHWSSEYQAYADYGLHTDKVKLQKRKTKPSQPGMPQPSSITIRVFHEEPKLKFVNAFGYVSLFPFLLHIIEPSSEKLGKILQDLARPDLLWTDYGLRSLATTSPLYMQSNTPSSPPYWRGAIWINMNYLVIQALRHYGEVDGPYRDQAKSLYLKLKAVIIKNMYQQYEKAGYIWEQYNDKSGAGQRAHPFTGWSALISLIMSEN